MYETVGFDALESSLVHLRITRGPRGVVWQAPNTRVPVSPHLFGRELFQWRRRCGCADDGRSVGGSRCLLLQQRREQHCHQQRKPHRAAAVGTVRRPPVDRAGRGARTDPLELPGMQSVSGAAAGNACGARAARLEAVAHGHLLALRFERGRRSRPKRRANATGTIFGPPHTTLSAL